MAWAELWSHYLGFELSALEKIKVETLCELSLKPTPEKTIVQWARRAVDPFLRAMPHYARKEVTRLLKWIRNPKRDLLFLSSDQWALFSLYRELSRDLPKTFWNGQRAGLSLTFDVDNRSGYRFLPQVLESLARYQLNGTFYFVTSYDYKIERKLIETLEAAGSEAELHCYTHDIGLAYRPEKVIEKKLRKALEVFPGKPRGFRSAALSISPTLLNVLKRLGFQYDSSMQVSNPKYHCTTWPFPFYLADQGLWEIPLTLQDEVFLGDSSFTDKEILSHIQQLVKTLHDAGALCVLGIHPHHMRYRPQLMRDLFKLCADWREEMWVTPMGRVHASLAHHLK